MIIESDSKGVIELINIKMGTFTDIHWVIFHILKPIRVFKTQHASRSCNIFAHSMATFALRKLNSFVWLVEISIDVLHLFSL